MTALLLVEQSDAQWSLSGPLNVDTIKRIWHEGHHLLHKTQAAQIELNLSGLIEPDSASVALLLDWLRYAKKHHKTIRFHHIPVKMQEIIRLSNLQDIFPA